MAEQACIYVQGSAGAPAANAVDDRTLTAALLGGDAFTTLVPGIGAIGKGHGVLATDAMLVTESSPAGAAVLVAPGMASVRGTSGTQYGAYICPLDATQNLTIDAKSSTTGQNRKDLIVARVSDNQYGVAGDTWAPVVIKGVTSGSATDPNVPAATLVLARVNVFGGAGSTVIAATNIDDLRPQARCVGGITSVSTADSLPHPKDFDFVWDRGEGALKIRRSGAWVVVGINYDADWTTFTPNWKFSMTIGNGTQFGRYARLGRTIVGVAGFTRGSTTTQAGTLKLAVPVACEDPGPSALRYLCGTRALDVSAPVTWSAAGDIDPATQEMSNFATLGAAVWSPTAPFAWATGDIFTIFFNYEAD